MAPLIMAHRGDSDVFPENTLQAFAGALEAGSDLVECDVQLTRDGHVVVLHDVTVDRTTNGHGNVRGMALEELRRLSAGFPARFGSAFQGERVPTLAETLGLLRGRARLVIEIKGESVTDDAADGIEARTVAAVLKAGMGAEVALISFEVRALLRCRQLGAGISRGYLCNRGGTETAVEGALGAGCDLLMPEKGMLSVALRDRAGEAGLKLATWVVDDPDELRALAPYALYGVATNRPGALLDAIWESE